MNRRWLDANEMPIKWIDINKQMPDGGRCLVTWSDGQNDVYNAPFKTIYSISGTHQITHWVKLDDLMSISEVLELNA